MILKKLLFILTYIIYTIIVFPIFILGFIIIPIALLCKAYEGGESKYFWEIPGVRKKKIMKWKWSFMYPWGNEEDGILCGEEFLDKPTWFRILYWTAIRNPTNNLRFIKPFNCIIEPDKIKYIGSFDILSDPSADSRIESMWYIAWIGWRSNFRWQFYIGSTLYRLWIGWKIYPSSIIKGVPNYQKYGTGFAHQFKRVRD